MIPEELRTRDWESVNQVALDLDLRLGWDPIGWKIGAATLAPVMPGPSVRRCEPALS